MTQPRADSPSTPRVAIASDHAGVDTKAELRELLGELGFEVDDRGPESRASVDYPDFAHDLARAVADGEAAWGVLVCGTGIGMSIAANKIAGARAALVTEPYAARMARGHNDANIIVVGARVTGPELIKECVREFARSEFTPGEDGRHRRRVQKLEP